jgi:RHS repeat-associated protein
MGTNGIITDTYIFDAFGNVISRWYAGSGPTPNNYLYCGQQWDPDLGLYYNRARYDNTDTGRFWSRDQTDGDNEDPPSLHKYLYCQADPVDHVDPSGHDMGDIDIGDSLDAIPNIVTLPKLLSPIQQVSILVTTIILPPYSVPGLGDESGIKTQQGITVNSQGTEIRYLDSVGVTHIGSHASLYGDATFFHQTSDRTAPWIYLTGEANTVLFSVAAPNLKIRYDYQINLNFVTHTGHLYGHNETFPTYYVVVNHKRIYQSIQENMLPGLAGQFVKTDSDFNF